MTDANPYDPPRHHELDFARKGVTLIPSALATKARWVVDGFGLFQFLWPLLTANWTHSLSFDIWALIIATNGMLITRSSFKRFPWTALMCVGYPVIFLMSLNVNDPRDIWNWLPARSSPVLALQLVSGVWAIYAIVCIIRCHLAHRSPQDGG